MTEKKKPPSYFRYKEQHPTVSVTVTKDLKEALNDYRGDLSYREAIKKLLLEKINPYQIGYNRGYRKGHAEGLKQPIPVSFEERAKKHAAAISKVTGLDEERVKAIYIKACSRDRGDKLSEKRDKSLSFRCTPEISEAINRINKTFECDSEGAAIRLAISIEAEIVDKDDETAREHIKMMKRQE